MDTAQIVVAVMWFFAAMVGGICGLGPAMMAVPVISFFVPIKTDILITCIVAPFASILLVLMHLPLAFADPPFPGDRSGSRGRSLRALFRSCLDP